MIEKKFFSDEVILLDEKAVDNFSAIKLVARNLKEKGIVNDSFEEAILKREKEYPTGLQLSDGVGVAIPHTDADKVNINQIGIVRLKEPVSFIQMGSDGQIVQVKMIFVLCLKEAHEQLDMLQNLMNVFSNSKTVSSLLNAKTAKEIINIICG